MSFIAFLRYADTDNPRGLPAEWPAASREVDGGEPVDPPWLLLSGVDYAAYLSARRASYDAWQLSVDLDAYKAVATDALWRACYDYNFQFFSGGVYALMLEIKLAGSTRAVDNQDWVQSLWVEYYRRKYAISVATTRAGTIAVSTSFEDHGEPPWSVQDMLAQLSGA